jgi:hypothetical protein
MSSTELTARINRFMDRKVAKTLDISSMSDRKVRRSPRRQIEVSDSPYIALAIK